MDRLLQIETFIAAVEHASFSDAARELKVTPAIIGRRVSALEKAHRSTRHLTLTEDGRQHVERCQWTLGARVAMALFGLLGANDASRSNC